MAGTSIHVTNKIINCFKIHVEILRRSKELQSMAWMPQSQADVPFGTHRLTCLWIENNCWHTKLDKILSALPICLKVDQNILSCAQFDEINWPLVHWTVHSLPCLIKVLATKHILDIAEIMEFLSHQDSRCILFLCPRFNKCKETCQHSATCTDAGRTEAFAQSMQAVKPWLDYITSHIPICSVLYFGAFGGEALSPVMSVPLIYPQLSRNMQYPKIL